MAFAAAAVVVEPVVVAAGGGDDAGDGRFDAFAVALVADEPGNKPQQWCGRIDFGLAHWHLGWTLAHAHDPWACCSRHTRGSSAIDSGGSFRQSVP